MGTEPRSYRQDPGYAALGTPLAIAHMEPCVALVEQSPVSWENLQVMGNSGRLNRGWTLNQLLQLLGLGATWRIVCGF